MFTETTRTQERTDSADDATGADADGPTPRTDADARERITGPHHGYDRDGRLDHRYWRCEQCGLETTDPHLREGCFRCGGTEADDAAGDDDAE